MSRLGSGLPCLLPDLGFPEFESGHLTDFSIKAQLSKSVASAIPPCPLVGLRVLALLGGILRFSIPALIGSFVQLKHKILSLARLEAKQSLFARHLFRQTRSGTITEDSGCALAGDMPVKERSLIRFF